MIEREGHSVLRDQFPTFSIKFATGNPSEWYLPRYQERFFEYIKGLIAVQRPPVDVAYKFTEKNRMNINTTEQSSWAPTSHVLVVNCEATKATISATIKAIPVHRYPLSPFEL